jgi:GH24 family phage-related lysozyme (muramidase)
MPVKVRQGYTSQVSNDLPKGIYLNPNIPAGAFGGQIGDALSNLGQAVVSHQNKMKAEKDKLGAFEANKAAIEFTIQSQEELKGAMDSAEPGAPNFAQTVDEQWKEKTAAAVQLGRDAGWSEEVLQAYELKLMGIRQTAFGNAQTFEEQSLKAKVGADIAVTGEQIAKFAAANPEEVDGALEQLRTTIDAIPDVDSAFKLKLYETYRPVIEAQAYLSYAQKNPQEVIEAFEGSKPLPKFVDEESRIQLQGVAPVFNDLMSVAEGYLPKGYSFQLGDRVHGHGGLGGKRTQEQQDEIVKRGASKTRKSKHIDGLAIDLTPYKDGKPDESDEAFGIIATAMNAASKELGVEVEWGGNWKNFQDKYHFQVEQTNMRTTPPGVAGPTSYDLIKGFEGFRTTPYWDVNALRTGYGSDTYTTADGKVHRVTKDTVITREDAERDIRRRVDTEFIPKARGQVGAEVWDQFDANTVAGLASVTYNYGELPDSVVRAAKTGDKIKIAQAVANLGANPKRRRQEAAVIMGQGYTGNPILDRVPADQRGNVIKVAQAAQDEINTGQIASFEMELMQGNIANPRQQLDDLVQNGIITKPSDFSRIENIIAADEKDKEDMEMFGQLMRGEKVGYPGDPDAKAAMNAGGEQVMKMIDGGAPAGGQADEVLPTLSTIMANTGLLPQNAVDRMVHEMNKGGTVNALLNARRLVSLLEQEEHEGQGRVLSSMLDEKTLTRLRLFQTEDGAIPEEQLIESLRPKTSNEVLAQKVLDERTDLWKKGIDPKAPFDKLIYDFNRYWGPDATDTLQSDPLQYAAFQAEYWSVFNNYMTRVGGDGDKARELTKTHLGKMWGVNDMTGQFMKYPPTSPEFERVYPTHIDGTKTWMQEQMDRELKADPRVQLKDGDRVFLFTDSTTEREAANIGAMRPDGKPVVPTYLVTIVRENGEREPIRNLRYGWEYDAKLWQEKAKHKKLEELNLLKKNNADKLPGSRTGTEVPSFFLEKPRPSRGVPQAPTNDETIFGPQGKGSGSRTGGAFAPVSPDEYNEDRR